MKNKYSDNAGCYTTLLYLIGIAAFVAVLYFLL